MADISKDFSWILLTCHNPTGTGRYVERRKPHLSYLQGAPRPPRLYLSCNLSILIDMTCLQCDDDIPLRQLVLQYSMTSKQNQAVGPSHSKSDSLPGNIHDAISLDPPAVKIPPVQSPAVRQKADLSGQPSSSRKRKKQLQETLPR